eukprot:582304-Prymnesium_polylepis.1
MLDKGDPSKVGTVVTKGPVQNLLHADAAGRGAGGRSVGRRGANARLNAGGDDREEEKVRARPPLNPRRNPATHRRDSPRRG